MVLFIKFFRKSATIMIQTNTKSTFVILFTFLVFTNISGEKPNIFLCIDSKTTHKTNYCTKDTKLVYGYINGKKTPCMSEHELRSLFSKEKFKDHDKEIQEKQKAMIQRNAALRGEKNLENADLRGMDLQGLDLSSANLSGALLESADLRNAKLINANLKGASLKNAYCKNTNFKGSNFDHTNINRTFFLNADLRQTNGFNMENLSCVATLYKSKFDTIFYRFVKDYLSNKLTPPRGTWMPAGTDIINPSNKN